MQTSLVHYDTERSHGTIPAPLTWYPPGYPIAIAVVSVTGCDYQTAALSISLVSFVLVAGGMWHLMRILDPSLWAARAAVLCWLTSSQALFFSVAALSESLFTLLGFLSSLFLMHLDRTSDTLRVKICWIGSAMMAGLSYWVRYAGILWVLTWMTIWSARILFENKSARRWASISGSLLFLLVLPLMIRNLFLVGDWRGGNNTPFTTPMREFARSTPRLWFHLAFGNATIPQLKLPLVFLSIGLIGLCVAAFRTRAARSSAPVSAFSQSLPVRSKRIVLVAPLIYVTGIGAIALRSPIGYVPRMYVPILPHLILLTTCGVAFILRRLRERNCLGTVGLAIVLCLLFGYTMANFISRASPEPNGFEKTRQILSRQEGGGSSIGQLLFQELKTGEVIAATNGQPAGYILNHPTLSLVDRPYSTVIWDEQVLRREMSRFGATHLLIFRDPALDPVVQDSRFLSALAVGQTVPWLRLVASSRDIYVYRMQ